MPRKIAAGNWKMNGTREDMKQLKDIAQAAKDTDCVTIICPPATILKASVAQTADALHIGGQNCHHADTGAFTGDISAAMIADTGAEYVIVGHSERRDGYGEDDALIRAKAIAALNAGLTPIICIGESLQQRESGNAIDVVCNQLHGSLPHDAGVVVAYEPIWAIGTGLVPSVDQIGEVHDALRQVLGDTYGVMGDSISILYGGSVKANNAADIFAVQNVDGALVGGASLTAADFVPIMQALAAA